MNNPASPTTIDILLSPAKGGRYHAHLDGRLICTSRDPEPDAARALLAAGMHPFATMRTRHAGSTTICFVAPICLMAGISVEDNEQGTPTFRKWRGPRTRGAASPIRKKDRAATTLAGATI